jgi:hypothetical protein
MGTNIHDVAAEVADRLRRRGIPLSGDERPEDLGDLLAAVERFEAMVEARGGDLMVDDLKSSEPDDPQFVLPARAAEESVRDYTARIDDARQRLMNVPRRSSS